MPNQPLSLSATSESQAAQLESLKRLALVAERSSNAVVLADADRTVVWVNQAFTALTGLALEACQGQPLAALLEHGNVDPADFAQFRDAVAHGQPLKREISLRTTSGEARWAVMDRLRHRGGRGDRLAQGRALRLAGVAMALVNRVRRRICWRGSLVALAPSAAWTSVASGVHTRSRDLRPHRITGPVRVANGVPRIRSHAVCGGRRCGTDVGRQSVACATAPAGAGCRYAGRVACQWLVAATAGAGGD